MTLSRQSGAGASGPSGVPSAAPRRSRVTLRDVAEAAGVSVSTASLVFSGKGPVSDATVERVRGAAGILGYAGPDPLASSLRQGRAGVVGVVVEGRLLHAFRDPFAISVLDGLAQVLDTIPAGMLLLAQDPEDYAKTVGQLAGLALDAVVFSLCGPQDNPVVEALAARGIPMVGTGSPVDPRVVHVLVDEEAATASATRHLLDLGHRRLAMVALPLAAGATGGPVDDTRLAAATYPDALGRVRGFLGVAGDGSPVVEAVEADLDGGRRAARLLLGRSATERPTGIVAQSDLLAAGVIQEAEDHGLRVPQDLSVVGFDGLDLPWLPHRLTTVEQHGQAKGRRLGELAAAALRGEPVADVAYPTSLRIGTTTASPPA